MNKLLTSRGRDLLALIVTCCILLMVIGAICTGAKGATKTMISIGQMAYGIVMVGLMWFLIYLGYSQSSIKAIDLAEAAKIKLVEEKAAREAAASITTVHVAFSKLPWWQKTIESLIIFFGLIVVSLAVTGRYGWLPGDFGKVGVVIFSSLIIWLGTILVGFAICLFPIPIFHIKLVDKWKNRFKELLREVEEDTGGK